MKEPGRRIRVTLVWPKGYLPAFSLPLPFAFLKSNLDSDRFDLQIIDCVLDGISARDSEFGRRLREQDPDIVGVSTWSPMFPEALEILRVAKEVNPRVTTLMGGAHATSYYQKVIQFSGIDFVFRGESEKSFGTFLEEWSGPNPDWKRVAGLAYLDDGKVVHNEMDRPSNLDAIRPPDFDFISLEGYQKAGYRWNSPPVQTAPLWITRGCPYLCRYCAAPQLNGRTIRKHGVEYMISEIQRLYGRGVRWFNIIDDNFTFDIAYAKDFCRAVIALKLKGVGFGTPNGIRMERGDPELWRLMKAAGWRHLMIAPESGSAHTLALMQKNLKLDSVPKTVLDIRRAGLKVQAFFIIGYPGETPADLAETTRLIRKCKFNFVFLANFHPLPGTPVYDSLVAQGLIEDGLLPNNFSGNVRTYTSPELADFNFPRFILLTHLRLMLNDPLNAPYQISVLLRLFSPWMVLKKVSQTVLTIFLKPDVTKSQRVFKPLHLQANSLATHIGD